MSGEGPFEDLEVERRVEALLFAAAAPLSPDDLRGRLGEDADVEGALAALSARYRGRGVELSCIGGRWRFATAPDLAFLMVERREEPRRLSRAAMETLAVVAYHQPCTRAEVEAIRGVALGKGVLDALLEIGWLRLRGRRRTPGRPVTYATTDAFMEHFGLAALSDLPGLPELKASGLLSLDLPPGFAVPDPAAASAPEEDPLEDGDAPEFVQDFVGDEGGGAS